MEELEKILEIPIRNWNTSENKQLKSNAPDIRDTYKELKLLGEKI